MEGKSKDPRVVDLSIIDLVAHGLNYCPECDGFGSSLKDMSGIYFCATCGGTGAVVIDKDQKNVPGGESGLF
jgi:DnaJ-class molecular chaperone